MWKLSEEASLGEMAELEREPIVDDELSKKLMPKIKQLSERFKEIGSSNRFILLRFHHDADGISGAFALSKVLKFSAYQQNSAVYSVRDAIRDLSNISHEENPLMILLDFGMNGESVEGLKLLKAAGVELIMIDHHPPNSDAMDVADFFLSPWEFSAEPSTSKYVAGYLAAEIAGEMGEDSEKYARVACAGDKSDLLELTDEDRRRALVLDYLAAHSGFGNNLRFYRNVLSNKELYESMHLQADEKINEAADKVMKTMKEKKAGDVEVYMLELESVVVKGEFPNRSKITTRVFEHLMREEPLIVLGLGERTVIMRINDAAASKGVGADKLAKRILETMPDFAESGGGHVKAGAIRVKKGFVDSVSKEIIKMINEAE